ncbi:glycosyltransferase [Methylobacterium sp. A49B]
MNASSLGAGLRVLHAPFNIGNQPWALSRHERRLGCNSELLVHYVPPVFRYPADRSLDIIGNCGPHEVATKLRTSLIEPLNHDVLHYYFGKTLMSWDDFPSDSPIALADLQIAKALGRTIIFTLQGCDVRLAGESDRRNKTTPCRTGHCSQFAACISGLDDRRRRLIGEILPFADKIFYLNPELGHFVAGAEFLPYCNIDIASFSVTPPTMAGRPRILHAPSDRSIKGTAMILAALDALRATHDFELIIVENIPHAEAMELYRSADIVIDQVLCGWYGGFAVEVMAMGKPVLCTLREEDFCNLPSELIRDLPICNIRPEHLIEDIGAALDARSMWPEWSARSRAYVERWHDSARIAAAMIAAYRTPTAKFQL